MSATRVLKFELPAHGRATIRANVVRWLKVDFQPDGELGGHLVAWAWCSPDDGSDVMESHLEVILTGDTVPPGMRTEYIGTAMLVGIGGPYVVHVFQVWP